VLVIDELSGEYEDAQGYFATTFGRLIEERYTDCAKTIITYNLEPRVFLERYGKRVHDRITEGGAFVPVAGKSVRAPHWQERAEEKAR
jgi:DNA replication protein DnaC